MSPRGKERRMSMGLRGTMIGWKWFVSKAVASFPVILLIASACTMVSPRSPNPSEPPGESKSFRYNHPLFIMELKNVEVFDNAIKMTFMYTNRTDSRAFGGPRGSLAYLVDNL